MGKLWNFFRFSLVSLAMLLPILSAKATTDETKLSLSLKNANLPTILKEIKNQTKYDFMYNSKEIDINKTISVNVKNVSLDSALKVCLTPFGLTYTMKDKIIILKKKQEKANAQISQHLISGVVKDKQGMLLPGVAVILRGTTIGTVTDPSGRFKINIPQGKNILASRLSG